MKKFRGTYTVLITPFSADGRKVDEAALKRLVDFQIDEGIHGLIPLGSTGEFLGVPRGGGPRTVEIVARRPAGRVPVLIGTGAEWTDEVVRTSREAESMGADVVMIIPPFYSGPTDDELYAHYKKVSHAISIPIMVYNNPATANVDMMPELIARIAQIPNCKYVKESTLDPTRVRDIIRLAGDRMTVFAGVLGYESFWLGAEGWAAGGSHGLPRWSAELFELVADKRDMDAALALYKKMTPLLWWVGGPRYVSGTKACFEMMGMPMGPPRAPRLPLPEAQRPALREVLREMGVLAEEKARARA